MQSDYQELKDILNQIGENLINFRPIMIIIIVILATVLLIKCLSRASGYIAKWIINISDKSKISDKKISYKRVETWLDVFMALTKILVIVIAFYVTWRLLSPSNAPVAVISAGALFVILVGGTIGPLLRDYTVGSMMIVERWYGVGDFIKIEPWSDVQGVVEQLTLRSTKIRGLSGEVIWIHNQNIQAVKVKYRGVTTIALDIFAKDKDKAIKLLKNIMDIVPKGPMMVINGLNINEVEQLNEKLWRIEMSGKTVPGREWVIEKFAVDAINNANELIKQDEPVILNSPIARYVDPAAEKRFKRIIK